MELDWLPASSSPPPSLQQVPQLPPGEAERILRAEANVRLDLPALVKLDRIFTRTLEAHGGTLPGLEPLRLAILGSSTTSHLLPGIRIAGLRRGLAIDIYETSYDSYRQELVNHQSALHRFFPQAILFAFDARHLAARGTAEAALEMIRSCWQLALTAFRAHLLQQTALPVLPDLLGNNEDRLECSPAALLATLNERLRPAARDAGVDLLSLDRLALEHGLRQWHEPALWYRAKQEVHPAAAALYGDHVARLLGAARGRSAKALVLDLDGTLWGGGIGDDGLEGIVLGPGSALGEAHLAVQSYALALKRRGIPLAVCSKNDLPIALEPFLSHPEMLLRRDDVAVFVANWTDKATNLRAIAARLNLGLDALVFVDDNPAERALVRRELPEVHVPELPEDPALFVPTLAAAGYFEATFLTAEDCARAAGYGANHMASCGSRIQAAQLPGPLQASLQASLDTQTTDLPGYLASLGMTLAAGPIEAISLRRATQLINKTNQFNLLTNRLTEAEVAARSFGPDASHWLTLACRLSDRFSDHGLIAVLMARLRGSGPAREAVIEDWVMSCRVLGRQVEDACLNLLVERALAAGIHHLTGSYRATAKNAPVRDLYRRLGFRPSQPQPDGILRWQLDLLSFQPLATPMHLESPTLAALV